MIQATVPVVFNKRIAKDHYLLRLKSSTVAKKSKPGQFVHLLCVEKPGMAPLLRRPISIFDADPKTGTIDLIYKVMGEGTEVLSKVRSGAALDLLGPLGSTFQIPASVQTVYLVGGGVGIPPLYFLAKELKKNHRVRTEVFLGARTKEWVICASDFKKLGVSVHTATDDGSLGHRGSVVDLLVSVITRETKQARLKEKLICICGPTRMMQAAAAASGRFGIPAQVSLEERMGCAMGVCMGCVVEVNSAPAGSHARFQRVCTEGPVFPSEEIVWNIH